MDSWDKISPAKLDIETAHNLPPWERQQAIKRWREWKDQQLAGEKKQAADAIQSEFMKSWKAENPQKVREYRRTYYSRHREAILEQKRIERQAKKEVF